jgi:hypothetical protein
MVIVCNRSLFNKYGWMAFVCYFENSKGTRMTKEALRLALETFESMSHKDSIFAGEFDNEITAIKATLEAKDEPYALEASMFSNDRVKVDPVTGNVSIGTPQQEAKNEPVAWAMLHDNGHFIDAIHPNEHARVEGEYITPLYTTPPQRKPLTEKELNVLGTQWHFNLLETKDKAELFAFARAIEAAHGIKGEA